MEIFRSFNGANDWTLVNPWWEYYNDMESKLHADIPEIRFYLDEEYNEIALISTDGGLYFSDDYLSSVQNISLSGLGVSQYYSTYSQRFSPYTIFAGSQEEGLQKEQRSELCQHHLQLRRELPPTMRPLYLIQIHRFHSMRL